MLLLLHGQLRAVLRGGAKRVAHLPATAEASPQREQHVVEVAGSAFLLDDRVDEREYENDEQPVPLEPGEDHDEEEEQVRA